MSISSPADTYLFKVNNGNTRKKCKMLKVNNKSTETSIYRMFFLINIMNFFNVLIILWMLFRMDIWRLLKVQNWKRYFVFKK